MGSIVTRAKALRLKRNLSAIAALVLLNLGFVNAIVPGLAFTGARFVCSPVFFCHSCPWATMACPLGVLVNFGRLQIVPFVTLGILGLVGTFGGRLVCGWICPFGWLQDMLHKIPTRKYDTPRRMRYLKYVLLFGFVIAVPLIWPHRPYTFCDGCPSGTLESMIPWAFVGHWNVNSGLFGGFTARFFVRSSILLAVLLLAVFVRRGFCRTLCPLGAIFGFFNKFSAFRYHLAHKNCTNCAACVKLCPVDMDPVKEMNGAECIRCYECTTTKHIRMGTR